MSPAPGEVLYENNQSRHIYVDDLTTRVEWKVGSPQHNRDQIEEKARTARVRMRQIAAAASFTNAQRDQAIRDVARVCANIIPLLLNEPSDAGDS